MNECTRDFPCKYGDNILYYESNDGWDIVVRPNEWQWKEMVLKKADYYSVHSKSLERAIVGVINSLENKHQWLKTDLTKLLEKIEKGGQD